MGFNTAWGASVRINDGNSGCFGELVLMAPLTKKRLPSGSSDFVLLKLIYYQKLCKRMCKMNH